MGQITEHHTEPTRSLQLIIAFLAIVVIGISYLTSSASFRPSSPSLMRGISQDSLPQRSGTSRVQGKAPAKIYIEHADLLSYDASLMPGVQKLKGNIILKHGNATMTCDSAYLNEEAQTFEAFGEVHMVQADTVNMYSRYLFYDGVTKLARLRHNVHLANKTTDL